MIPIAITIQKQADKHPNSNDSTDEKIARFLYATLSAKKNFSILRSQTHNREKESRLCRSFHKLQCILIGPFLSWQLTVLRHANQGDSNTHALRIQQT